MFIRSTMDFNRGRGISGILHATVDIIIPFKVFTDDHDHDDWCVSTESCDFLMCVHRRRHLQTHTHTHTHFLVRGFNRRCDYMLSLRATGYIPLFLSENHVLHTFDKLTNLIEN